MALSADKKKLKSNLLLLLTAMIWGAAFAAQSIGAEHLGPFSFNACRGFSATAFLFVFAKLKPRNPQYDYGGKGARSKSDRKALWTGGILCGVSMFAANVLQQAGLSYTTAGKSGFVTSLYVVLVPLLETLFGRKASVKTWVSVALAASGLYFLCVAGAFSVNYGDLLTLLCAAGFAVYIMIVDRFAPRADSVFLSCVQFGVLTVCSAIGMLLFEEISFGAVRRAVWAILYAGVLSSGVAYTLQIAAQRDRDPTTASLLMSLESVFALAAGMIVLGQFPTPREGAGCLIMFFAIVVSQLPDRKKRASGDSGV